MSDRIGEKARYIFGSKSELGLEFSDLGSTNICICIFMYMYILYIYIFVTLILNRIQEIIDSVFG